MAEVNGNTSLLLPGVAISVVSEANDGPELSFGPDKVGQLLLDPSGSLVVQNEGKARPCTILACDMKKAKALRLGRRMLIVRVPGSADTDPVSYAIKPSEESQADDLARELEKLETSRMQSGASSGSNLFDDKTDKGSADLYFYYYGLFQHQQNMMQDLVRTGTYYYAITENRLDFAGKVVMDVGAGSSILSQFAAQAGARKVYAVEASPMAMWAAQLCKGNPVAANVVEVVQGKVEVIEVQEKADMLVSEPMGTLLVNERMLESYIYARDHFLKPGGKMFPTLGRIHLAAFSDPVLHQELSAKGSFWTSNNFYGVDLTPLLKPAAESFYNQVVVDAFDPSILVSETYTKMMNFMTIKQEDLAEIRMPLNLEVAVDCMVHGIACWFDVLFDGSTVQCWLTTAPGQPTTHWFQLRCALQAPMQLRAKQRVTGEMVLKAHSRQSYDIELSLSAPGLTPGGPSQKSSGTLDLKDPYYRQMLGLWQSQQQ